MERMGLGEMELPVLALSFGLRVEKPKGIGMKRRVGISAMGAKI
jgi:hypothetical protein